MEELKKQLSEYQVGRLNKLTPEEQTQLLQITGQITPEKWEALKTDKIVALKSLFETLAKTTSIAQMRLLVDVMYGTRVPFDTILTYIEDAYRPEEPRDLGYWNFRRMINELLSKAKVGSSRTSRTSSSSPLRDFKNVILAQEKAANERFTLEICKWTAGPDKFTLMDMAIYAHNYEFVQFFGDRMVLTRENIQGYLDRLSGADKRLDPIRKYFEEKLLQDQTKSKGAAAAHLGALMTAFAEKHYAA